MGAMKISQENEIQKYNLLVRISKMYYLNGKTHQAIADEIGLSRIKITRLLQEAMEKRVVEIKIKDPIGTESAVEEELCARFHLEACRITPSSNDQHELYDILGRYAVEFLTSRIRENMVIGIGWGRTLVSMIPHFAPVKFKNITVVSLTGGLASNPNQPNPYDVASSVAKKLGAALHYPLVPAIAADQMSKELLLKDDSTQKTMKYWKKLDLALVSIGNLSVDTNIFYTFPNPAQMVKKVIKNGAVGDLLMNLIDANGTVLTNDFSHRLIRIEFEQLRRTPLVVGISGGIPKAQAILAALRTGILNVLITDEATAKAILQMLN
ncbi:MAG: sugar-binding transcriptional regulator [Calditrichaeota bacterium]|nr:MAG: sugar-binding transcriptional regulator [Calditrichota bacterium]